jgi:hypothetical protein
MLLQLQILGDQVLFYKHQAYQRIW